MDLIIRLTAKTLAQLQKRTGRPAESSPNQQRSNSPKKKPFAREDSLMDMIKNLQDEIKVNIIGV